MRAEDHPLAERLRILSASEVAGRLLGGQLVEAVSDEIRKAAFQQVAKDIVATARERRKFGFSVDTGGAIRRALEWAFKAGRRSPANPDKVTLPAELVDQLHDFLGSVPGATARGSECHALRRALKLRMVKKGAQA